MSLWYIIAFAQEAIFTYNSRYATEWSFCALHKFFTDDVDDAYRTKFFTSTLPAMIDLALRLPQLCTEVKQSFSTFEKIPADFISSAAAEIAWRGA